MQKKVKYILDDNVKKLAKSANKTASGDIPQWLSKMILMSIPFMTVIVIYNKNPLYLSSSSGYATGNNAYYHINEALSLKEYLQNGTFNFWFPNTQLGYPMFLKSAPLPAMITAVLMICLERLASPLCIFRWIIVLLMSFMSVAWYKGGRGLLFTRFQCVILSLLVFTVSSKAQAGLDLDTFLLQGHYPLLFSMFLMPVTISKIYLHGMQFAQNNESPVYFLALTYLCHKATGLYCSIISLTTMFVFILTKEFSRFYVRSATLQFVALHVRVILYLSWWIIPVILTYPYSSRSTVDSHTSFFSLLESYVSGQLFDFHRQHMWLTCLTVVGLAVLFKQFSDLHTRSLANLLPNQTFCLWFCFVLPVTLFLNAGCYSSVTWMVPFDFNSDNSLQAIGLHCCGLYLVSIAVAAILNVWSYVVEKSAYLKILKFVGVVLFSVVLLRISTRRISERLTFVEVGDDFETSLKNLNMKFQDGRILLHHKLGTGGSWDLANIPHLSGKPGLMSSSYLQDEHLSSFYLDSMTLDDVDYNQFREFLELYNVHYMAVSNVYLDRHALLSRQARHITTVDDIHFSEIEKSYDNKYGYFDFVRLPGHIDGNLNNVRQTVLTSLQLYGKKLLFYLNPRRSSNIRQNSLLSVQVLGVSFYDGVSSSSAKLSLVNWKLKGEDVDSLDAVSTLEDLYEGETVASYVVEEMRSREEYHAVVQSVGMETPEKEESLLLKVSYHPFWRCSCLSVSESYTLKDFDPFHLPRNRSSPTVHHVTPNMIAVQLPAGRYHVIFRYRFPGILKLLALVCFLMFMHGFLNLSSAECFKDIVHSFDKTATPMLAFLHHIYVSGFCPFERVLDISMAYHVCRVISFVATPVLTIKSKCSEIQLPASVVRSQLFSFPTSSWLKNIKELLVGKRVIDRSCTSKPFESQDLPPKASLAVSTRHDETFSDKDSSFSCDGLFVNASPPTPPKHTKKSVRKRHARSANNNNEVFRPALDDPDGYFRTSSIRVDHSPRVRKLLSELRNSVSSSSQEVIVSRDSNPTVRRRIYASDSDEDSSHYVDTYQALLPNTDIGESSLDVHNDVDVRHDINVDLYLSSATDDHKIRTEETAQGVTAIDVSHFIAASTIESHDNNITEQVDNFSPERSSSPDLSSPDQLSVSLDDLAESSSFEYMPPPPNEDQLRSEFSCPKSLSSMYMDVPPPSDATDPESQQAKSHGEPVDYQ